MHHVANLLRLTVIPVLLSLALTACTPSTSPSTTSSGKISSSSIAGASGLYAQASSSSKGIKAVSLSGATIYQVSSSGTASSATFYDESGTAVSVTVNSAAIRGGYLFASITYSSSSAAISANTSTGSVVELSTAPANYDTIRVRSGNAYYISGSRLYRTSLTTGTAAAISSSTETLSSAAWLVVTSGGAVFYVAGETQNGYPVARYYAAGVTDTAGTYTDSPLGVADPALRSGVLEDDDGALYALYMTNGTAAYAKATLSSATPPTYTLAAQTSFTAAPYTYSSGDSYSLLGSEPPAEGSVYVCETGSAMLHKSSGSWDLVYTSNPSVTPWYRYNYSLSGNTYSIATADTTAIYNAVKNTDGTWYVYRVPETNTSSTTSKAASRSIDLTSPALCFTSASSIADLALSGGLLFYTTDSATMVFNPSTGATSTYSSTPVSIEALQ